MKALRRFASAFVVVLLLLLLAAPGVLAHAELEESNPAEGSTVTTPLKGSLTFDEELNADTAKSFVVIVDASGTEVARGEVSDADPTVMQVQLPELPPGAYTLRWQATTADDDATERDEFAFTVAAATASAEPIAGPTADFTSEPSAAPGHGDDEGPVPGSDLTLALAIAAIAITAVLAFVLLRTRRR